MFTEFCFRISKHSDLTPKVQDAVVASDAQNVFAFQSTGLLKVISETPSFLRVSTVQTHDL